jgi:hypothetical protein
MKKLLVSVLTVLTILLSACSSSATGTPMSSTNNDLPIETQLAVGTLKLAGTEQDITADQAQELVILWQVYKELSQSDTAAQAEVDGLIAQIQDSMTNEQTQAITAMQITQQDVFAAMQGVALESSDSASNTISLPSSAGSPSGAPPSGGEAPPDGGMPPDMGGVAPASNSDASQSAQAGTQGITEVPSPLVETVIQALQQKIAG